MIHVLVVDDSAVAREGLSHLINSAPGMSVVGTAADGLEAAEAVRRLRPTIITMDIIMPRMGGPEAIERIMQTLPTPIVVVTGNTITDEVRKTFESLECGALAIVPRPSNIGSSDYNASAENLISTLRLMSEIKVVRRLPRRVVAPPRPLGKRISDMTPRPFRVVVIGASTGGPSALRSVLNGLRPNFPVPIVVVQHIAPGFVAGFVSWLSDTSALRVKLATQGEKLAAGTIYVAPDGSHLGIGHDERVILTTPISRPLGALCPSVAHMFDSVAQVYGPHAVAVLLTGMGRDGADGMLKLQQGGAITIAQDKESSVVHGMPGEAIALGAADYILSPPRISELLTTLGESAAVFIK